MKVCGTRTTQIECYLKPGHPGMHEGLLKLSNGTFADIAWCDEWHAGEMVSWVNEAQLLKEDPMVPVCMFGEVTDDPEQFEKWSHN